MSGERMKSSRQDKREATKDTLKEAGCDPRGDDMRRVVKGLWDQRGALKRTKSALKDRFT